MKNRYFTPPIPNGWFGLAYVDELPPGTIVPLRYFARDLVLFRTESGEIAAFDAHCPYCGAHFAYGGTVAGELLRCPKHGTTFDVKGRCIENPLLPGAPALTAGTLTLKIVADHVIAWHHAEGLPPQWDIPDDVPEWGTPDGKRNEEWTDFERRRWKIRTRNQEMAENAVDSVHFHYVHGTQNMPVSQAEVKGHILRVFSDTGMETPQGHVDGSVESLSYGFGIGFVRFKGLAETLLMSSVTPIDEDNVDVRFSFAVKKLGGRSITRGVGLAFINEVSRQLGQDIPIWENKIQLERPMITEGDGPVGLFRRWSKQFYSYGAAPELALFPCVFARRAHVPRTPPLRECWRCEDHGLRARTGGRRHVLSGRALASESDAGRAPGERLRRVSSAAAQGDHRPARRVRLLRSHRCHGVRGRRPARELVPARHRDRARTSGVRRGARLSGRAADENTAR
jgi:3-ketosteroid 9alpha-monooxygenase subunit A